MGSADGTIISQHCPRCVIRAVQREILPVALPMVCDSGSTERDFACSTALDAQFGQY